VWHFNRSADEPQNAWHAYKGQRKINVLFGDAHVANTKFVTNAPINLTPNPDGNAYHSYW
jgi:prepilin-type processing-associated H-X9-DG protein